MIGTKINIKAYQAKKENKKQNDFSIGETLLDHYDTLSNDSKKIAKTYFKSSPHESEWILVKN